MVDRWPTRIFVATIAIMRVDPHRRSEARSIAYHRSIADRLRSESTLLENARARVKEWLVTKPDAPYVRAWQDVLGGDVESIAAFLIDPGERACELRQSSPFAGALSARERWRIWRETKESGHRPS